MDLLTTPKITHHVRCINPDQIYHVMSKTWGGLYLMAPKDGLTENFRMKDFLKAFQLI